ncbi:MAG: response regulator [Gammaproteobacteria bacterium]
MQIVLVEDDLSLAGGLQTALIKEGFVVNHVTTGKETIHVVKTEPPDIIILDLGLPDMDGLEILQKIRSSNVTLPVLLLTARDSIEDKVSGLDSGADDYLAKPFDMLELLARLRALERRVSTSVTSKIVIDNVSLDTNNLDVTIDDELIDFSRREHMLLKVLMQNANKVLTRDSLETKLYQWGDEVSSNTIEVHIHHLRKKLPADFIKTIRGVGYRINKSE